MRVHEGTVARCYWPLYEAPATKKEHCCVCGRNASLEQHHVVWRSWGECRDVNGRKLSKPTVTLCGFGNTSGCHKLAHERRLHFRWVEKQMIKDFNVKSRRDRVLYGSTTGGYLEYLVTEEPCGYLEALEMDGWERLK